MSIKNLQKGESLAYPIRSQDGRILLSANAVLTDKHLDNLIKFKINSVYIEDEFNADIEISPAVSDDTKTAALVAIDKIYKDFEKNKNLNDTAIKNSARSIAEEVLSNIRAPINLFNVYSISEKKYLHALNTAIITAAISYHCEVPLQRMIDFVTAALLHDIALKDIDADKQDATHMIEGAEKLKNSRLFSAIITSSIALHHEHFDGTGKPKKMAGEDIFLGARILAVADQFDNLVYGIGCKPLPTHHAVEYLHTMSSQELDPQLLTVFSKSVAIYPTGATVLLNNGHRAVVVKQNEGMPERPIIRLLMPERENCLEFNLVTNRTLFIESVEL